ncbi:RNA polymerase sigma factor [Nonomuraea sp. NPDC059022]|uniref:RNA polymerase sigma factor n=1 Tax=Nonomuraea sp. NPDC059022 TaxID=3346705 RepID=UPI003674C611
MSRELCEHYGPHLYDYCRTELGESDAELAAAGTLLTASARAGQVTDPAALRPWLYALARAHRAARAASHPASTGSWARSSRMSDLLPEALIALDGPYRELLDLSVRHGLPHAEIALLFDVPESLIDATVREAAWRLETWLAAVTAARAAHGCAQLAGRVAEWAAAPSRSTRARLGRHLYGCVSCLAAPKGMPAATLLTHLPIAAPRGPLSDLLPLASPLAPDTVGWRADGFPVQSHGLGGVPHARLADGAALATPPPSALTATHAAYADARAADPLNTPVADPTTATGAGVGARGGAAGPPPPRHPTHPPPNTKPAL